MLREAFVFAGCRKRQKWGAIENVFEFFQK